MYPVSLAGQRLKLREFAADDTEALHKVYGDADATRHLSFEARTLEQVERIVKAAMDSAVASERCEYMLAVADIETEELIGAARIALGEHDSGQIGFALRPDHWGARSPLNEISARTMLAVGMIEEGRIRGHLFTRGAWRDSIVYSILSDEYEQT